MRLSLMCVVTLSMNAPRRGTRRTCTSDRTTALTALSKKSELAVAIHYTLSRWSALTRYRDDGRLEINNNIAINAVMGGRSRLSVHVTANSKHSRF